MISIFKVRLVQLWQIGVLTFGLIVEAIFDNMLRLIIKISQKLIQEKQLSYKNLKSLQMQKPQSKSTVRTSSKKLPTQQQTKQGHKNQATQNQKYQNIKQFKMEIDYQIAKCLDTLDRQGLKYLKETLKSSNVFNQEIKEVIAVEKSKEKGVAGGGSRGKGKVEKSPVKGKNQDQIQEEIVEEYQVYVDNQVQEPPSKDKTKLGPNPTNPLKQQKIIPLKLQKFQDKIQQPLKPFAKRTASRQGSKHVNGEQQIKKAEKKVEKQQQHELTDKSQIDNIVDKISNLPEQKLKKVNKFIQLLQRSQRLEEQQMMISLKQARPYLFKPEDEVTNSNQSNMRASLKKNKKNEKATSLHDSIIRNKKNSPVANKQSEGKQKEAQYEEHNDQQLPEQCEVSEEIPEIDESQHYINQPKIMDMPDQMMKEPPKQSQQEVKKQVQQKISQINMGKRNDSGLIKKGSFIKNFPISNIKKPLDIEVTQSHQADTLQLNQGFSQSKMVRLGKKKLGTNKVKIVLLRNRGHPSIIGLTCIQLYNTNGKQIPITLQNICSQSPKLLKLFNSTYKTTNQQQMFTTIFKRDYEIDLQISQKIGGMKIWNYNKSEIDNTKQTDWIQLYINDRLTWEGYINKGSYNQINDYVTIAVVEEGFQFADKGDRKGDEDLVQNYRSQNVNKGEGVGLGGNIEKNKQRDAKKVDWLENTLMQQKIKKIMQQQQQDKKVEPQIRRTATTKLNRFSQLYSQQQSINTKIQSNNLKQNERQKASTSIGHKKQEQYGKLGKLEAGRQKQLIKQIKQMNQKVDKNNNLPSQRANRTSSQKIEEKDIFSSFGQSLIKEKNKVNQINAKTNQILEKVDKLKETYSKKDIELGYSSLITKQQPVVEQKQTTVAKQQQQPQKNVQKKPYNEQSIDDFMNDSLFQDPAPKYEKKPVPPISRPQSRNIYQKEKQREKVDYSKKSDPKPKIENKTDIDDLLNQLNDLVGSKQNRYQFGNQKQKSITIPQLPKGNKIQISLFSNWGDQQYIGLNKIQFFDNQGQRVYPSQVKSSTSNQNMINSIISIFSQHDGFITQQTTQWKCQKKQNITLILNFGKKVQFSLIRVWNFVGDRVHSMVGVKKMEVLVDGSLVFVGDVRKNAGTSRDQILRSCQNILFTNNTIIQKRILQSDWLANQLQNLNKQTILFKKTSQNFMRPQTTCQVQRQLKQIQNKQPIKLPKRNCFQYDPPTLPSGYYIRIILHTTWGDRDFVGLNGIVVYDQAGMEITDIKKICQFPAPLVTLAGYEKDRRVLSNLFDGKNLTSSDQSIWLAPYLRDVDKMQKQAENSILIEFNKACTFSAVNIYNYVKTPTRGARQIEIYVDNSLVYRGYLRMANLETGEILTTINFTKDTGILEKIGYAGYHEDNLGQQVIFYNQGKIQKPIF